MVVISYIIEKSKTLIIDDKERSIYSQHYLDLILLEDTSSLNRDPSSYLILDLHVYGSETPNHVLLYFERNDASITSPSPPIVPALLIAVRGNTTPMLRRDQLRISIVIKESIGNSTT